MENHLIIMNTLECQKCSIRKFKDFCKENEGKILKYFYFYRNNIEDILYESNNVIDIKDLYNGIEFS